MAFLRELIVERDSGGLCVGDIDMVRATDVTTPAPRGLCGRFESALYAVEIAPHLLGHRAQPIDRLHDLLEHAVRARHVDVVDALIPDAGKPLSALLAAVSIDDADLVSRLVDDPNTRAGSGTYTALGAACLWVKPLAAHALLAKGAHVERGGTERPLLLAVEKTGPAALDVVMTLLEHGANIEAKHSVKGWTPLMRACLIGDAKIVERLLRAGADANATDKSGMTPLKHAAVGKGIKARDHDEIVELLRGYGATE
jgi:hypothetical protein